MAIGEITGSPARAQGLGLRQRLRGLVVLLAGLAVAALAAERIWLAAVQPLWFDEAWSLAVATCPDWRSVVHEALTDVNAPLGYFLLHAWTAIAGPSDLALRLPCLIAVAIAAALPLAWPRCGLTRDGRLAWAVMLFAWWGVDDFLAGRAYGLLLAFSTAQALAFADLVRTRSMRAALTWSALGALGILTHYYALVITAVQGLTYLALARRDALRKWPAALAFLPAFGWLALHAPRLAAFSGSDVAWHPRLGAGDAVAMAATTLNPSAPLAGLSAAAVLLAGVAIGRVAMADPESRPERMAVLTTLAALGLTVASGLLHPSLTARYLIPVVPGLLLGLVLLAERMPRPGPVLATLAALYLVVALRPDAMGHGLRSQAPYGFEAASSALMRRGATDIVFAWDHEVSHLMPPATLQRVGGVFFRRAAYPVQVTGLATRPDDDVNRQALAAARGARPGIIWIYNRAGRTSARAHPLAIPALDPRWKCARFGDATVGSYACLRDRD